MAMILSPIKPLPVSLILGNNPPWGNKRTLCSEGTMDWKNLYMNYEGRINRQPFWLGLLALIIVQWIVIFIVSMLLGVSMMGNIDPNMAPDVAASMAMKAMIPIWIVSLLFLYPVLAVYTKRWHDRDKSGWWSLIILVPIIGAIWFLVECGFLRGTEGPNRFGNDPLA
jgi:uncharacterized membrane protein YhaH (DUF805 family)